MNISFVSENWNFRWRGTVKFNSGLHKYLLLRDFVRLEGNNKNSKVTRITMDNGLLSYACNSMHIAWLCAMCIQSVRCAWVFFADTNTGRFINKSTPTAWFDCRYTSDLLNAVILCKETIDQCCCSISLQMHRIYEKIERLVRYIHSIFGEIFAETNEIFRQFLCVCWYTNINDIYWSEYPAQLDSIEARRREGKRKGERK